MACLSGDIRGLVQHPFLPEDITRLLHERPEGVEGLALPGMPIGSPGMEMGDRTQSYQVFAFGSAGSSVFASYE
ncbi:DUF411 domain-containing protein [Aurantiacibacter gilvus]|uniref:DUF411 domain-containing protein n=1 Tax=Aurantiacibacter gilvus TaxID=3139141 RepID=UPI003C70263B